MKKRIFALICSAAIALGNAGAFAEYTDMPENTNETRIADILTKLGIMNGYEDGSFKPSQAVTRAEFVTLIYKSIKSLNGSAGSGNGESGDSDGFNWRSFFLGSNSNDLTLIYPETEQSEDGTATVSKGLWEDVGEDHWAYEYLKPMKELGIISGYGNNEFKPDNTVTYNEAVKIILSVCGYTQYADKLGGYPDGYLAIANQNDLHNSITASGTSPMSRMDAATLIYNSFPIKLMPSIYEKENDTKNFLNDIVGVYTLEGTLLSTDITSIYGEAPEQEFTAKIGEVTFTFDESMTDIRDFIGRDLRVFLNKDSDDDYSLVAYEVTKRDDVTVINNKDLTGYNDYAFTYTPDEKSSAEKRVKIKNGSVMIYNGKYLTGYNADTFDNIGNGTITVIKKQKLDFDIVVVEEFITGYIDSVHPKKKEFVNLIADGDSVVSLEKTDSNDPIVYSILNADGQPIKYEELGEGAVNYYCNGDYVKLYYVNKKISGKIKSDFTRDDGHYIKIGNDEYLLSKNFDKYIGTAISKNTDVATVLDMFGEVAWITDGDVSLDGYVYLIKNTIDEENDALLLTYYALDTNGVKTANTDSVVRWVDENGSTVKMSSEGLRQKLSDYDGVAKIVFDSDGKIKKIEAARNESSKDSEALKMVLASNDQPASANYKGNLLYRQRAYSFGGKYYINANTKILQVPTDRTELNYYSTTSYNSIREGSYLFKLYSFNSDSPYAKVAIIYKTSEALGFNVRFAKMTTGIVLDREETINNDDEPGVKLIISNGETTTEVFAENETDGKSLFDKAFNACNEPVNMTVSPGDFVHVVFDSIDNTVSGVRLFFDADGVNPAWCSLGHPAYEDRNKPEYNLTSCPAGHEHTISTLGNIPGTTGFTHDTTTRPTKTNPIGYSEAGVSGLDKVPGEPSNHQMWMYGYVYQDREGLLELTSENLREHFNGTPDKINYSYNYYDSSVAKYKIIHKTKNGYTIENGSKADLRTYKQAGSKCSRALFDLAGGGLHTVYIFSED